MTYHLITGPDEQAIGKRAVEIAGNAPGITPHAATHLARKEARGECLEALKDALKTGGPEYTHQGLLDLIQLMRDLP